MEYLTLGSTGPFVKLVQSLLNRIGYNAGPVDGILGDQTFQAVIAFQADSGLVPDGVVGPDTWNIINQILRGYDTYYIRPGDTIYNIAQRYRTSASAILTANPGIDPNSLFVGQPIVVPYGIDVVFTDIDYTYEFMELNIQALKARYPFIEVGTLGTSVAGKNLYYIRLGTGSNQVSYNASHHANEWITSLVLMKFVEDFAKAYSVGGSIRGYSIPRIWDYSSIYIVPMVNPDGVNLVVKGIQPGNPYYEQVAQLNGTGQPLERVWKANIRGVDLNLNYPAGWEEEKQIELSLGITGPAPSDYAGPSPLSEPETVAMVNFTTQNNFRLVLAYHSQGEVIYYQYADLAPPEALQIAQLFSQVSGYAISENPEEASYAGYKDWFIQEYRRPGYTIEVGRGENPLPLYQFPEIYEANVEMLLLAALV
ncbi:peptidoglycan-binding protein [Heliobacterium chlorum]|uniref:Peptidoglycan-binding protein n=1 Tax=Heliobacterium chlorum TaxID=2698 RepID=A0ABR7T357_HELCL|nr:M14 family metallopeptidase [Heliobacterium chlorum]MBC9785204.1 peptidoglycan-binding protein [Heliobacterium chlorum]